MPAVQRILHPTDFSENSRYAFATACALARDYHATLVVLHVVTPSSSPLLSVPPPDPMQPVEAQESLGQFPWPQPADPQIRVEHRLAEGNPAEEILRLTRELHCDLIVMGSHGRTGLGRFLTGSVAEAVLRKEPCPVTVVKVPLGAVPSAATETTAEPGEPIDVRPLGSSLATAHTRTLIHTTAVGLVRLVLQAGQETPPHETRGQLIVHCLEGRADLSALGKNQVLEAGTLVYLPAGEPHALKALESTSVLLTILAPQH